MFRHIQITPCMFSQACNLTTPVNQPVDVIVFGAHSSMLSMMQVLQLTLYFTFNNTDIQH